MYRVLKVFVVWAGLRQSWLSTVFAVATTSDVSAYAARGVAVTPTTRAKAVVPIKAMRRANNTISCHGKTPRASAPMTPPRKAVYTSISRAELNLGATF
jgi:hypothetical protein